jgi:hypothetical protein
MSEKDVVKAIGATYAKMGNKKRVETIRGLFSGGRLFFLKFFPRFHAEAFPELHGATGGSGGAKTRRAPSGKRHSA